MSWSVPTATSVAPIVVHRGISEARWDGYVKSRPQASGYHLAAWLGVIARAFGHEVCPLAAESVEGLVGVLPLVVFESRLFGRFLVSMPFVNYGGVVADTPAAEAALLDAVINMARERRAAYLELRHTRQTFPALASKRHKVAMTLTLQQTPDRQWQELDRKVRNQVRKAEKSGLDVKRGGPELLPAFYQVFARNMRDLGTPVYGRRFFEETLRAFPENTRVFSVWLGSRPVAASLVYWHNDLCEVPWASSLREFNSLCPNVLLYWEMLSFAIELGFRTFDLGRSTPGQGTYHFKRQWGAQPHELVWEYWTDGGSLPDLSPKNHRFEGAIALWRRLPVGLTNLVGPRIVRNIP